MLLVDTHSEDNNMNTLKSLVIAMALAAGATGFSAWRRPEVLKAWLLLDCC
jgi:hypothetical protein